MSAARRRCYQGEVPGVPYIYIDPQVINFNSSGTNQVITIVSNVTWAITGSMFWNGLSGDKITISQMSGIAGTTEVILSSDENLETSARETSIRVEGGGIIHELIITQQTSYQQWLLVSDFPLSSNLLDISGNGNDIVLSSGSVSFTNHIGEDWTNSMASVLRFNAINQLSYINGFKIEVEFVRINTNGNYECLIDGADDGSTYKGVQFGKSWGTYYEIGIRYGGSALNTYGMTDKTSADILLNKKYKCTIENRNGIIKVDIHNVTDNILWTQEQNCPTYTSIARSFLQLGSDSRYGIARSFQGYFKNFKLYVAN